MLRIILALVFSTTISSALRAESLEKVPPDSGVQVRLSFAPVVKKAQPAVVNVYASRIERAPRNPLFDDPLFRQFFGGDGREGRSSKSLGSGVLVDPSGLVVTNHHVIEGMTEVKVSLADHREFEAEIVLRDQRTDLAVLKLKATEKFPVLPLGDSDALEVGDFVIAIGNPFGVGQTVTQGIISALARTNVGISDFGFFIQTDAAINPGNSGGALVDLGGRLVGINSAIFSRSGGSMGIGFAIPVNMVKNVVATAKTGGAVVKRPWLGASLQNVTSEMTEALNLEKPIGAVIVDVGAIGPAIEAGLKRNDVITAVDGITVDDSAGVGFRLGVKPLGGVASLTVSRSGKTLVVPLKLAPAPETPPRELVRIKARSPFQGAEAVNLSPAVIDELSLAASQTGIIVIDVAEESLAAQFGVQKGDAIASINGQTITSTKDFVAACGRSTRSWQWVYVRDGRTFERRIGG